MKKHLTGSAGFTYIELIVGMALTVMLLSAVFGLLSTSLTSWRVGSSRIEAQQTARIGLDAMVRELRYEAVSILTANGPSSNTLRFVNRDGETVEFFRNGNTLSRRLIVGGLPQTSSPIAGSGTVTVNPTFTVSDISPASSSILHGKKIIGINVIATETNNSCQLWTTIIPVNT